MGTNKKNQYLK